MHIYCFHQIIMALSPVHICTLTDRMLSNPIQSNRIESNPIKRITVSPSFVAFKLNIMDGNPE